MENPVHDTESGRIWKKDKPPGFLCIFIHNTVILPIYCQPIAIFVIIGNTGQMNKHPGSSSLDLLQLEKEHEKKRKETLKALENLKNARRLAFFQLHKTIFLFKYLNWKQQERIDALCGGNFSLQRIYSIAAASADRSDQSQAAGTVFTEETKLPVSADRTASMLARIKIARQNILQFGIIEARAVELTEAIIKSVAVFNHQYRTTLRELFPLGFISRLIRSLRRYFNHNYFSWQEMGSLEMGFL